MKNKRKAASNSPVVEKGQERRAQHSQRKFKKGSTIWKPQSKMAELQEERAHNKISNDKD